jgi:hypothetical protein
MDTLPLDLACVVAAIADRFTTCRLVSYEDVRDELPARRLSQTEIDALLAALTAQGFVPLDPECWQQLAD